MRFFLLVTTLFVENKGAAIGPEIDAVKAEQKAQVRRVEYVHALKFYSSRGCSVYLRFLNPESDSIDEELSSRNENIAEIKSEKSSITNSIDLLRKLTNEKTGKATLAELDRRLAKFLLYGELCSPTYDFPGLYPSVSGVSGKYEADGELKCYVDNKLFGSVFFRGKNLEEENVLKLTDWGKEADPQQYQPTKKITGGSAVINPGLSFSTLFDNARQKSPSTTPPESSPTAPATDGEGSTLAIASGDKQQLPSLSNAKQTADEGGHNRKENAVRETHCNKLLARFRFVLDTLAEIKINVEENGSPKDVDSARADMNGKNMFYGIQPVNKLVFEDTGCELDFLQNENVFALPEIKKYLGAKPDFTKFCPTLYIPSETDNKNQLNSEKVGSIESAELIKRKDGKLGLVCKSYQNAFVTYKLPNPNSQIQQEWSTRMGPLEFVEAILHPQKSENKPPQSSESGFTLDVWFPSRIVQFVPTKKDKELIKLFCSQLYAIRKQLSR